MNYFTWVRAYRAWKEAAYRLHYVRGEAYDNAVQSLQIAEQAWIDADLSYTGPGVINASERATSLLTRKQARLDQQREAKQEGHR
jgi:hypothetical protein